MKIEEAIEIIEYARAFNERNTPLMVALDTVIDAVHSMSKSRRYHFSDLTKMISMPEAGEPLTVEQLREMDGPVWCSCKPLEGGNGYWCLCQKGNIITPGGRVFDVKEIPHWVFYSYPPAHIDRSKWTTKNITDQHPVDQFICSECGAIFEDFSLCKIDEDSGDKEYYEYELKFCPACGRAATKEAWAELERRLRG